MCIGSSRTGPRRPARSRSEEPAASARPTPPRSRPRAPTGRREIAIWPQVMHLLESLRPEPRSVNQVVQRQFRGRDTGDPESAGSCREQTGRSRRSASHRFLGCCHTRSSRGGTRLVPRCHRRSVRSLIGRRSRALFPSEAPHEGAAEVGRLRGRWRGRRRRRRRRPLRRSGGR